MRESNVFVRGNALSGLSETFVGGESVLDTYERVMPRLRELAGDEAASLFARPAVLRGNGETETSVSWYVPRAGAVRPWSALSADERIQIGAEIGRRLDRLRAAFDDPEIGDVVQSWLAIPSLEHDLLLVGGEPHLLNWGLVPESVADDAAARHAHFRRTLGLFGAEETPSPRIGPRAGLAGAAAAAGMAGMAAGGAASAAPLSGGGSGPSGTSGPVGTFAPGAPPPGDQPVVHATEVRSRSWIPVAIAAGIAALVLLILLIPGILRYDREATAVAAAPALDAQARAQAQDSLRRRIAELQRALEENVCRPVGSPGPVEGLPTLPATPGAPATPGGTPAPQPLVPPSPAALPPPVDTEAAGAPSNLLEFLDRGTALVVAPSADGGGGASVGSAFFVNERQLVTNRHVVEGADPSRVAVVSKAFGGLVPARVVAASGDGGFGSADFAVLEVEPVPQGQVLTLATPVARLQNVIAVGYPGFIMETDAEYQRLTRGDGTAIPDPAVTQGSVVALQTSPSALPLVVHTATIAGGNSGGPLVDSCGRVVGVNTFGRFQQETLLRLNFALGVDGLRGFLDANGVVYATAEDGCAPAVVAQAPDDATPQDVPPGGEPPAETPPAADTPPAEAPPVDPAGAPAGAARP